MNDIERAKELLKSSNSTINIGPVQVQKRLIKILLLVGVSILSYSAGKAISSTQLNPNQKIIDKNPDHNDKEITLPTLSDVSHKLSDKSQEKTQQANIKEKKQVEEKDPYKNIKALEFSDNEDATSLSKKALEANEQFLALAIRLEEPKQTVYFDNCGANIGLGYCLTVQVKNKGRENVINELTEAGIDSNTAKKLTSDKIILKNSRSAAKDIKIDFKPMLILTKSLQPEYKNIAQNAINTEETPYWDKLPSNTQDALTWLAYNTGEDNFPKFKKLIKAVRLSTTDLSPKALATNNAIIYKNLSPWFSDPNEPSGYKENNRAGAFLIAAWQPLGISFAIHNPELIEAKKENKLKIASFVQKEVKNDSKYGSVDIQASNALAEKGLVNIPNANQISSKLDNKTNTPTLDIKNKNKL